MKRARIGATKLLVAVAFGIGLLSIPGTSGAEGDSDVDPLELMQKADDRHRIHALESKMKFVLQKEGGKKTVRKAKTKRIQDDEKGDKLRIEFTAPEDIAGLTILTLEDKSGDDEQWLHIPSFDKTRRIGMADLGDRFASTDIFYEDLKRRYPKEYDWKLLGSDTLDGEECWVLRRKPGSEKYVEESPYSKAKVWLRKDILYVVQRQFFDQDGDPLKKMRRKDLSNVKGKAWRWGVMEVTDIQRDHRTTVIAGERTVKESFDDETFSKHTLGD